MTTTSEPGSSILAFTDAQTEFNETQLQALRQIGVGNNNRADLAVFFHQCRRTGLDPFLRQIYLITRMTWNPETNRREPKATIQTGIDGYRLVVRRAVDRLRVKLRHDEPLWCGSDGVWRDVWLDIENPPVAAKYTIYVDGEPFTGTAHYVEFAAMKDEYSPDTKVNGQTVKGQKTGRRIPSGKWVPPAAGGMPAHMLAKCAEALADRKAFPQDLSGVYIEEEMEREGKVEPNGKEIIEAEPAAPTGNDWLQMIADAPSGEALNEIFFQLQTAKEMTGEIRDAITERGRYFRDEAAHRDEAPAEHEEDPQ